MKVETIDIVLFVLFFQLVSISPFLLFQKKRNSPSNQILGFFLLAKALCISNFIGMRLSGYTLTHFPHLLFFGSSFTLLWGPLLYLYTKSLTFRNYRFRLTDTLHLLPFLIHFLVLTFRFHLHSAEMKRSLFQSGTVIPGYLSNAYYLYLYSSIFIYTILAMILVWTYRLRIRQTLSTLEKQQLSWLAFVLTGFFMKWIFDIWYYLIPKLTGTPDLIPLYASRIVLFVFIDVLIYKAMKQPQLFTGIEPKKEPRAPSLSEPVAREYVRKLSKFMENQKPYYNPRITLDNLAESVEIPPRSLSEVINGKLGQNFYDFINMYRIQESQRLLGDLKSRKKTVLEVLYEVGFNSKSSFNIAFKKHTGMTPLEFRRSRIPVSEPEPF